MTAQRADARIWPPGPRLLTQASWQAVQSVYMPGPRRDVRRGAAAAEPIRRRSREPQARRLRPAGEPDGRPRSAARSHVRVDLRAWPATRGRGSPARCAGRRRLPAGGWRRCAAARAGRCRAPTRHAAILACTTRRDGPRIDAGRRGRRGRALAARPGDASEHWPAAGDPVLRTARSAGMPTGTVRSLLPLPSTRTVRRPSSRSPTSSPHSSLTRMPVAYSSSMIAVSRSQTAAATAAAASRSARYRPGVRPQLATRRLRCCEHRGHLRPAPSTSGSWPVYLRRAELRARVGGQPAAAVRERGERPGRRGPPGHGRARLPCPVLARPASPQHGDVQVADVAVATRCACSSSDSMSPR